MELLILGTSLQTAIALSSTMIEEQIKLCDSIIDKINANDIDKSIETYKDCLWWLQMHCNTLDYYRRDLFDEAEEMSDLAERYKPSFITDELIKQNKSILNKLKDGR